MKEMIKNMFGLTIGTIIGGEAIRQVGGNLTGSLKGIGGATQSMIGIGILGNATKLFKWK